MRPFLIDKIMPVRSVHLFGGPSGAGKSRMLFQWFKDLALGNPIIGLTVPKPVRIGYVCLDRTDESVLETMECLDINPSDVPNFEFISCADRIVTFAQIPHLFTQLPELIVVDGIPVLLPSGDINKYTEVANFMRHGIKLCKQYDTTFMGVLHCAKTKENERYLNPRQRISGSVAWAAFSETIFLLEPIKPESRDDDRSTLTVLPRNAKKIVKDFVFNDKGQLIEYQVQEEQDKYNILMQLIPCDHAITRDHILDLAFNLGIARAQVDTWLKQCLEDGTLTKPEYGKYQRRKPQ